VRIIDGRSGTAAVTRVLIDSSDGTKRWSTVGAAPSILQASWQALADGVEFGLTTNATEDRSVMHESDDRPPAR
jgi:2-isopropylmalate synthase